MIHSNYATTRPDSVASLEPGKAAIDAATIMAIRLGGACIDVLYANDGELVKQWGACINKLYDVSDSEHKLYSSTHTNHTRTHAHMHPHTRTQASSHNLVVWLAH